MLQLHSKCVMWSTSDELYSTFDFVCNVLTLQEGKTRLSAVVETAAELTMCVELVVFEL